MGNEVKNKNVVILGAARSGLAAARLLHEKGANVFVSDSAPSDQKQPEIQMLQKEHIDFEFNGHSQKINEADFIVLSPGIPNTAKLVAALILKGIPVYRVK